MTAKTWYTTRCPLGDACSKKQKRFPWKESPEEVRKAVDHHLRCSPFHRIGDEHGDLRKQWVNEAIVVEYNDFHNSEWDDIEMDSKDRPPKPDQPQIPAPPSRLARRAAR